MQIFVLTMPYLPQKSVLTSQSNSPERCKETSCRPAAQVCLSFDLRAEQPPFQHCIQGFIWFEWTSDNESMGEDYLAKS